MKREKTFETYLIKNQTRSKSSLDLKRYAYSAINQWCKFEDKINERLKENDPDEEMEDIMQDWANHLSKNPVKTGGKMLTVQVIKQYVSSVNHYLKYRRFRTDVKNITFSKELQEERYAITREEIIEIFNAVKWKKQGYYLCLISSGARPIEILGLSKKDLEWRGDRWKALVPARLTKKGMARTIRFSKECNPYLNRFMKSERYGDMLFTGNPNLETARNNENQYLGKIREKLGGHFMDVYESTGFHKINLYCFRGYFFTRAQKMFDDDTAHALIGHGAYLQQYQRRTIDEKMELWSELESEVLVFDLEKKNQQIKKLQEANTMLADQKEELSDMLMRIRALEKDKAEKEIPAWRGKV